MKNLSVIALLSVIFLTGCVTREQADTKLANACAAAAEVFLEDGFKIKEIKNQTFGDHHKLGSGHREVRVTVFETDEWLELDKEYQCIFTENMGPFGLSHTADIYQLKFDDKIYGQSENGIQGTLNEINQLGNAVNTALGK